MGHGRPARIPPPAIPPPPPAPPIVPPVDPRGSNGLHSPDAGSSTQQAAIRLLTYQPSTEPVPVIYGAARVGGLVCYQKLLSDGTLLIVYLVGHGPINSISNIKVDGKTLAELGLTVTTDYEVYTGTAGQGVSPLVSANETQWVSGLPGLAYVVIRFKVPTVAIPAVDPYRFECDVQGLLVRDPRTDATLVNRYYRTSPALAIADLLTSKRYGAGIADANVDWSGSVTDSANFTDFVLTNGAPRYQLGLALRHATTLSAAVDSIRSHAQLFLSYNNGQYQIVADQAQSASGITYDDGNILEGATLLVRGSAAVPTSVAVRFIDSANDYKDGTAEVEHPGIAAGTVERVRAVYDQPGHPTFDQAKRAAIYLFNRAALDKELTFRTNAEGVRPLPGNRIQVTSTELSLVSQDVLVTDVTPDANGLTWTISGELYDASIYSDTPQTTTAGISTSLVSPYTAPPDIVPANNTGAGYWLPSRTRLSPLYPTANWIPTNLHLYDGTKVNDGNVGVAAFDWNVAGASSIVFDAGVGNTKRFREVQINYTSVFSSPGVIAYSDDNISYTFATNTFGYTTGSTLIERYQIADAGAHRYWKISKPSSVAEPTTINEIQLTEYGDVWPQLGLYRVYDTRGGGRTLYAEYDAANIPTSALPLALAPITTSTVNSVNGQSSTAWSFDVVAVSRGGIESPGVRIAGGTFSAPSNFTPSFVPQSAATLTLANGANQNISASLIVDLFNVSGPTAAFTIGGIAGGVPGRVIVIENRTGQQMSIMNADLGSSVGNRIITYAGGNITLAATGGVVGLIYSSNAWVVLFARDTVPK